MEGQAAMEARLLGLNREKDALEAEMCKFSGTGAGRTIQERRRKGEVEERLGELKRQLSSVRMALKKQGY
jgi:hypothetical protein